MTDTLRSGLARVLTRAGSSLQRQAASFQGAKSGRWAGDWTFGTASINGVIRGEGYVLRDRARDLVMNNATAARIPSLFSTNVSGKDGILFQAAVMGADGEPDEVTNKALEEAWYRWSEDPRAVSADGRLAWPEIEQLTDELEPTDGETLIRLLPGFLNEWRFALQVLDPDQLDLQLNRDPWKGQNAIVMGVEVDAWGAPVAYHLWPNHPSERTRRGDRVRVPADQILHNFLVRRAGQARGVTWFAPIVSDLMHLGKYREAEVIAARMAAAKMGFIKGGLNAGATESMSAEPGAITKLGAEEEFVEWNPSHPNGNHEAFERAVIRSIAGAVRVSYMSLSGDLTQTSYASGRMGYLGEKDVYRALQARRILRYSRPVHAAWLPMAILSGRLDVRGSLPDLMASDWRPRPFLPVDELKAENADAIRLALGKTCLTDLVEAEGGDLRKVLQKRKKEIEMAKDLGVPLYLPVGNAIAVGEESDAAPAAGQPAAPGTPRSAITPRLERVA